MASRHFFFFSPECIAFYVSFFFFARRRGKCIPQCCAKLSSINVRSKDSFFIPPFISIYEDLNCSICLSYLYADRSWTFQRILFVYLSHLCGIIRCASENDKSSDNTQTMDEKNKNKGAVVVFPLFRPNVNIIVRVRGPTGVVQIPALNWTNVYTLWRTRKYPSPIVPCFFIFFCIHRAKGSVYIW